MPARFQKLNTDDPVQNRVQDNLAKVLDPLTSNPLLERRLLENVSLAAGTNHVSHGLGRPLKGWSVVRVRVGTAPTPCDWTAMSLTSPFTGGVGSGWKDPQYRVTTSGRVELRGLFTAASAPSTAQVFWTFPSATLAPRDSTASAGRLFKVNATCNSTTTEQELRLDVYSTGMAFQGVLATNAIITPVDWTACTLNSPWVAMGSGFYTPAYRVDGAGRVWLRGAAKSGTIATNVGSVPAGIAPSSLIAFSVPAIGAGPTEGYSRLNVNTNGTFGLAVLAGGGTCTYVDLDGVSWDISAAQALASITYASLDGISWEAAGGCPPLADLQDSNAHPDLTLDLVTSASVTVDLEVF